MNLVITGGTLDLNFSNLNHESGGLLARVITSYSSNFSVINLVLPETFRETELVSLLAADFPNISVIYIGKTQGALCSALLGLINLDLSENLFIAPADSFVQSGYKTEIQRFINSGAVAGTVCFEKHDDSWSFLRIRNFDELIEISEKRKISEWASTGFFMFREGKSFLNGAEWALKNSLKTKDQYFTSGALQSLIILNQPVIAVKMNEVETFHSFRTNLT